MSLSFIVENIQEHGLRQDILAYSFMIFFTCCLAMSLMWMINDWICKHLRRWTIGHNHPVVVALSVVMYEMFYLSFRYIFLLLLVTITPVQNSHGN
jgi:hypothetical protein